MNKSLALLVLLTVLLAGTEHAMHSPGPSRVSGQDRVFETELNTRGDTTTGRADEEDRASKVRASELQALLERVWPEDRIEIIQLPKGVVLKGTVRRVDQISALVRIAEQFFPHVISLIGGPETGPGPLASAPTSPPAPAFGVPANTPYGTWAAPEGLRPPLQPSNPTPNAPTLPLPPPSMPLSFPGPPRPVPATPPAYDASPEMKPGLPTMPGLPSMPGMPMPGMGPGHDIGRELTGLREEIQQLRQEVRELKDLLRQRPELRATITDSGNSTDLLIPSPSDPSATQSDP